jgi:hypothetical protein
LCLHEIAHLTVFHRRLLLDTGLPKALIDRVYIGLFVYTIGFHQLIFNMIKHAPQAVVLIGQVWRTYIALIECSDPPLYQFVLDCVEKENQHRGEARDHLFNLRYDILRQLCRHSCA